MPRGDRIRLQHMLDAARDAMRAGQTRARADLDHDRMWALGLVKCIEIIGEAAARTGQDTRERYPQVPWAQIVAMRNRLIHAYFEIDLDQVWKAVTEDMPALAAQLEKILTEGP